MFLFAVFKGAQKNIKKKEKEKERRQEQGLQCSGPFQFPTKHRTLFHLMSERAHVIAVHLNQWHRLWSLEARLPAYLST